MIHNEEAKDKVAEDVEKIVESVKPRSAITSVKNTVNVDEKIKIVISKKDHLYATIRNGPEGVITRYHVYTKAVKKENKKSKLSTNATKELPAQAYVSEILRFHGKIGPVVKIDGTVPGLKYTINGTRYVTDIHDMITFFHSTYSLSARLTQLFREVIESYVFGEIERQNFEEYASSPITVVENVVKVSYPESYDVASILKELRVFYNIASHPAAFVAIFSWALIAPLHDDLKRRSVKTIQTPQVFESGKTRSGKTTHATLFLGKGYNLTKEKYFYSYNRVASRFTLTSHLAETNLPALLDDLPADWIVKHREDLKTYGQIGIFGDRGRPDLTLTEYRGRRSFIGTINEDIRIDDDLAVNIRLLLLKYGEREMQRKNKIAFDTMFDALPDGFMFSLFQEVFAGMNINEILIDAEKFESAVDWVNYGTKKINNLCRAQGVEEFPEYKDQIEDVDYLSNAFEIAQAFVGEWERIEGGKRPYYDNDEQQTIIKATYHSKIENEFKVERSNVDGRIYIHFTGGAFKALCAQQALRVPYSTATNFINNIKSSDNGVRVEFSGKMHSIQTGKEFPVRVFTISIPAQKEMQ